MHVATLGRIQVRDVREAGAETEEGPAGTTHIIRILDHKTGTSTGPAEISLYPEELAVIEEVRN